MDCSHRNWESSTSWFPWIYSIKVGPIPTILKGVLSLIEFNFSQLLFIDSIPIFIPFHKSQSSSFEGNKGLCGHPPSSCGLSTRYDQKKLQRSTKNIDVADDTSNTGWLIIAGSIFNDNFKQATDFDVVANTTFKDENKSQQWGFQHN